MRRIACTLLLTSAAWSMHASAADTQAWHGAIDSGYTATAGNSASMTLLANARGSRTDGDHTHNLALRAKNSEERGQRTAEAYHATGKEDIAVSTRAYLFLLVAWDKDRFAGYDYQATAAAGYGRKLIDETGEHLSIEAGPGYRRDKLPAGGNVDSALLHVALAYDRQLTATSKFRQTLQADAGEDNTQLQSLSELSVNVSERLAVKTSLDLRRNSAPPAGTRNTDRVAALGLAWSF